MLLCGQLAALSIIEHYILLYICDTGKRAIYDELLRILKFICYLCKHLVAFVR